MVIQSNMTPKAIDEVWESTKPIFVEFNVPITNNKTLESIVESEILSILLNKLNDAVSSSTVTCVEGG